MVHRGDEKLAWLERVLPLENLGKEELGALGACTDRIARPAGTELARQGDIGREAFVVVEGEIEVRRDGESIARLGSGEVVGELAVLGGWYRTADIIAATDVELIVFDVRSLERAMHVSDALRRHVEEAVATHTVTPRLRAVEDDGSG
jgi:CRP/FNR family transcriptional regulator, cyclic AMP receptor protein